MDIKIILSYLCIVTCFVVIYIFRKHLKWYSCAAILFVMFYLPYMLYIGHFYQNETLIVEYGANKQIVLDVSGCDVEDVKKSVQMNLEETEIIVESRGAVIDFVLGDICEVYVVGEDFERVYAERSIFGSEHTVNNIVFTFNNEDFIEVLKPLQGDVEAEDAYIAYENGLYFVEEEKSSTIIEGDYVVYVMNEITNFETEIVLEDGMYSVANIQQNSEGICEKVEELNEVISNEYQYSVMGDIVTMDISSAFINPFDLEPLEIDMDEVEDIFRGYIYSLQTFGSSREFTTSYGDDIVISGGDYGWWVKYAAVDKLLDMVEEGNGGIVEVEFFQIAETFDDRDYSDTYVEISIDNQKVWMYVDGECILESDVVTGDVASGMITPTGVYSLTYKQENATLTGETYSTMVNYWMPFNMDIGMHDATWRGSFGGSIYKYDGSHGCVNMSLDTAKTIYENINSTSAIIVW